MADAANEPRIEDMRDALRERTILSLKSEIEALRDALETISEAEQPNDRDDIAAWRVLAKLCQMAATDALAATMGRV